MSTAKRLDNQMAGLAYQILQPGFTLEVRTRMRQLPARLRGGGLAATYAFILSHSGQANAVEKAYTRLAEVIARYVAEHRLIPDGPEQMDPYLFLEQLSKSKMTPTTYTRISLRVEALAGWMSRLSDALEPQSDQGGDRGQE
ncbi:CRISPR-associated protein Cmr5 family [Nocardiopsis sp. Huas11]|uniref:type III-B CRISPR module-associated protein Cmr5 n=1 Tax=Nocardiopsis sp. Huas11 TaxID=2183912 RepID=UPI000EB5BA05|nr:type III-B CRISPR module-associated protein Cmr5 [Nocardiopsis sp. Huas11]RKS07010.1 CRISPR-associated protein Cmr5 family [Nocardiopsis sp. Huas11]